MDVEKIKLTKSEKKLLRKIKKHGSKLLKDLPDNKALYALRSYGLIESCYDSRYPENIDEHGEKWENAYRVSNIAKQYNLYLRSLFWPEFRAWLALILSAIAIIISIVALTRTIQVSIVVSESQQTTSTLCPTELFHK